MKSRIAIAVSVLTLGTALAATPSFAQTNNQPGGTNQSSGTTAQQGCIHFGQTCSNQPYPMNNQQSGTSQNGTSQNGSARSASSAERLNSNRARVAQERERGTGDTYRLGPNGYYNYQQSAAAGPAGPSVVQQCEMRFRSYDPATGTYMGFDGTPHACP